MKLQDTLTLWADWLKSSKISVGYSACSTGFSTDGSNCWNDFENEIDRWICEAVNASVNDLEAILARAIYHHYLSEDFLFGFNHYWGSLHLAHKQLERSLKQRHIVLD